MQRQVATIQRTQKRVLEVPQMQYVDKFIDVPVHATKMNHVKKHQEMLAEIAEKKVRLREVLRTVCQMHEAWDP